MKRQEKIGRHLQERLDGEVLFDPVSRELYSTAACIYRVPPLGVVRPRDAADVMRLLRFCATEGIPVHPRGGGSGVTGGALGRGIVCDFSRYLHRIGPFDPASGSVRVEPGATLGDLNRYLAGHGRFFAPDPSSQEYCTLGGMIGNNSAGARSLRYGSTRDHLLEVEAVSARGEPLHAGAVPLSELEGGWSEIGGLLRDAAPELEKWWPRTTKNSAGYQLPGVREGDTLHLHRLLAGSEGTLALVTAATLQTLPIPDTRAMSLLLFDDLDRAGRAVVLLRELGPSMLEIMDVTFIEAVRKSAYRVPIDLPDRLRALLLLEFEGESREEVQERMSQAERLVLGEKLAFQVEEAWEPERQEKLRAVRKASSVILNRLPRPGDALPKRFIEDGAVPPERLPEFIRGLHGILDHHGTPCLIFGHAGDGNLHLNPFIHPTRRDYPEVMNRIADDVYALIRSLGGTTTAEHGDGWLRTPYLPSLFGPLFETFRGIKARLDPENLLNPGKIATPAHQRLTHDLREEQPRWTRVAGTPLSGDMAEECAIRCTGCGACRSFCPVFLASRDERLAPRAKINLAAAVLAGEEDAGPEGEGVVREILAACAGCMRCHRLCPSGVAAPEVIFGSRSMEIDRRGRSLGQRLLSRPDLLLRGGAALGPWAGMALVNPILRRLAEALVDLDRRAPMPPFSGSIPLREPAPPGGTPTEPYPGAVYFAGCAARWADPSGEGQAALDLIRAAGTAPILPEPSCCGLPSASKGDRWTARRQLERTLELLHPHVEQGLPVLVSCPSCGLTLSRDGPVRLPGPDSEALAGAVTDIHAWLAERLASRRIREPGGEGTYSIGPPSREPLERVVVHVSCHQRELGWEQGVTELLRLLPGIEVVQGPDLCCGMGGSFGASRHTAELAACAGQRLAEALGELRPREVLTSCQSCRMQLDRFLDVPVEHPLGWLRRRITLSAAAPTRV